MPTITHYRGQLIDDMQPDELKEALRKVLSALDKSHAESAKQMENIRQIKVFKMIMR